MRNTCFKCGCKFTLSRSDQMFCSKHCRYLQKKDIIFKNGYPKNAPQFTAECTISEGTGHEEWGANKVEKYYILTIHRIYGLEN